MRLARVFLPESFTIVCSFGAANAVSPLTFIREYVIVQGRTYYYYVYYIIILSFLQKEWQRTFLKKGNPL